MGQVADETHPGHPFKLPDKLRHTHLSQTGGLFKCNDLRVVALDKLQNGRESRGSLLIENHFGLEKVSIAKVPCEMVEQLHEVGLASNLEIGVAIKVALEETRDDSMHVLQRGVFAHNGMPEGGVRIERQKEGVVVAGRSQAVDEGRKKAYHEHLDLGGPCSYGNRRSKLVCNENFTGREPSVACSHIYLQSSIQWHD